MKYIVAKDLLNIEAVFLRPNDPFTWASGIKSPIYCDNRLTLAFPSVRRNIEQGLAALIKEKFPAVEAVMGTATAGIAHAAIISEILEIPMGYVRSKAKDHGRANLIEGKVVEGQKVVVVEDLISTGGSVIDACNNLKEAGFEVLGVVSIFTYGLQGGYDNFAKAGYEYHSLSNFDALIEVAIKEGKIQESDKEKLLKFRSNPKDPAWMDM